MGLFVAAGTEDAERIVRAMLAEQPHARQEVATPVPGVAVGRGWHGRLPHERGPVRLHDGLVVGFDGEMFDDAGTVAEPESLVAGHYRAGTMDRLAWCNGSFLAVVLDPDTGAIVMASDRHGSRALFVWHDGGGLAAATHLGALLTDGRVPRRLSPQGFAELTGYLRTLVDHTQYADVTALPAATVRTVRDGRSEQRQVRRLAWSKGRFSEREAGERLADALVAAMRRRTGEGVRYGLLMSGGLDSRLVLGCGRKAGAALTALTAGPAENREVGIARAAAEMAGAGFRFIPNPPEAIAECFDAASVAGHGLFVAATNLYGLFPTFAEASDVLFSGHALDYTLRGFYLPKRAIRIAGSRTGLPRLRPIRDGSPDEVDANLTISIPDGTLARILRPGLAAEWKARRRRAMAEAIALCDFEDPYDAWDAYILHSLSRHYAWSDFAAMSGTIEHRAVAFDPEVFDLYLSLPPAWRASGKVAHRAMTIVAEDLMRLPNANTGFSARYGFNTHVALVLARAALHRMRLLRRAADPHPMAGQGSWTNYAALFRHHPCFRDRLARLTESGPLLDTGLFDRDGMRGLVSDHLEGRGKHTKMLHQLLTLDAWFRRYGYTEIAAG